MSDCVFCTKLEQWVGNPKVCQRRVQVPSLFAGCSGCDFSPLSETVVSKTKMVFNDPPALENSKVATAWLSGDKLIGKPPVKGNYDYSRSSRESKNIPVSKATRKPVKKDAISTSDLINDEARK